MSDLTGMYIEDAEVGLTAQIGRTVTDADLVMYAGISGDTNPVHLNDDYAKSTPFEGRIAHGMLTAGLISAVIGTKMPGPGSIYLSQTLKFKAPVRVGDTVTAKVTVEEVFTERKRVRLSTICSIGETIVLEGEATVMLPSRG